MIDKEREDQPEKREISRRGFLAGMGTAAFAHFLFAPLAFGAPDPNWPNSGGVCKHYPGGDDICDEAHGGDFCATGKSDEDDCEEIPTDPDVAEGCVDGMLQTEVPDVCNPPANADYCNPYSSPAEADDCPDGTAETDICDPSNSEPDECLANDGTARNDLCLRGGGSTSPDICNAASEGPPDDVCDNDPQEEDVCTSGSNINDNDYCSGGAKAGTPQVDVCFGVGTAEDDLCRKDLKERDHCGGDLGAEGDVCDAVLDEDACAFVKGEWPGDECADHGMDDPPDTCGGGNPDLEWAPCP